MDEDKTISDEVKNDENNASVSSSQQIDYLVKQISADLDKLTDRIKEQRQMVKDTMTSDSKYQELSEKIKDLNKQRQEVQKNLSQHDSVKKAKEELQDLNEQKKSLQDKLSEYLRQYVEEFGSKTLEDLQGNLKQIITQYKLVKQRTD